MGKNSAFRIPNSELRMQFEKWQACGNDFILVKEEVSAGLAKKLCDRHYGIGADEDI